MIVLDRPTDLRVHEHGDISKCYRDVTMLQAVFSNPEDGAVARFEGNHVRVSVVGYASRFSPHYHTRVVMAVTSVDEVRPVTFHLRSVWPRVKHDFVGASCKGWPR